MKIHKQIKATIDNLDATNISSERKEVLQSLIDFVQTKVDTNQAANLNFICTHNSRRSHLSQIWAQTLASYHNIHNVTTYSGGTEATAMFPKIAETLIKAGFSIEKLSQENNSVYAIKYGENAHPIIGFSKKYAAAFNPTNGFGAIITCSQADKGCPFIFGAEKRIPITYEDPKLFDGKENQAEKYEERSIQIATEMLYVFSSIKKIDKR